MQWKPDTFCYIVKWETLLCQVFKINIWSKRQDKMLSTKDDKIQNKQFLTWNPNFQTLYTI